VNTYLQLARGLQIVRRPGAAHDEGPFRFVAGCVVTLVCWQTQRPCGREKTITCPKTGEVRIKIDVDQLALKYQAQSFETTLSGLKVLTSKLSVSPGPCRKLPRPATVERAVKG